MSYRRNLFSDSFRDNYDDIDHKHRRYKDQNEYFRSNYGEKNSLWGDYKGKSSDSTYKDSDLEYERKQLILFDDDKSDSDYFFKDHDIPVTERKGFYVDEYYDSRKKFTSIKEKSPSYYEDKYSYYDEEEDDYEELYDEEDYNKAQGNHFAGVKSNITAYLILLFLGLFAAHKIYLAKRTQATIHIFLLVILIVILSFKFVTTNLNDNFNHSQATHSQTSKDVNTSKAKLNIINKYNTYVQLFTILNIISILIMFILALWLIIDAFRIPYWVYDYNIEFKFNI